jgi:hypothetical protein
MQAELREIQGDGYEGVDPSDFGMIADVGLLRARATVEPERNLLLAVLTDAIIRYQALATVAGAARRRDLGEAERWLFSNDRRWACSFVNVCEALGIAPDALRRQLVRWRAAQVRRQTRGSARRSLLRGNRAARQARTVVRQPSDATQDGAAFDAPALEAMERPRS